MTRLNKKTTDRLLDGAGYDDEPVAALLTAVKAPPRPDELTGETAALIAFRQARRDSILTRPATRRVLARVVIIKAAVALALISGVALAASSSFNTGPEPDPSTTSPPTATEINRSAPNVPSQDPIATATPTPTTGATPPEKTEAPATPDFVKLCRTYRKDHSKGRDGPPVAPALIDKAGGRDKVDAYCRQLVGGEGEGADPGGEHHDVLPAAKPLKALEAKVPLRPDLGRDKHGSHRSMNAA